MFEASITDLGESSGVGDAATKHYVETLVGASAGARVGEATLGPAFSVVNPGHHTINCGGDPTKVFSSRKHSIPIRVTMRRSSRFAPGKAGYFLVLAFVEFQATGTYYGNVHLYKNEAIRLRENRG